MALLPYPREPDLSDAVRAQIDHFEKDHGRPSLLRRVLARFPAGLSALDGLYHPVMESGVLDRRLKEILFVVSATNRECPYCSGGHSRFLVQEFGLSEEDVKKLRVLDEQAVLTAAERAAAEFVAKISREPFKATELDIKRLESMGYSDDAILEMTVVAAVAGFTTTVASTLHLEDDLETFGMSGYF